MFSRLFKFPGALLLILLSACTPLGSAPSPTVLLTEEIPDVELEPHEDELTFDFLANRSPDVPDLPFPDNPDPTQCGIPQQWGDDTSAYLTGYYDGELIQPIVLLYDSHLRLNIAAEAPHGSEVKIILFQQNPVIDYYLVKVVGAETPIEGWIPAPFLSFEPVTEEG